MGSKFYEYRQNNSGGSFYEDDVKGIGVHVVVEANSAREANDKAESIGLYFDGCESGSDCPCCGDRWYTVDESDGYDVPSYYGEPLGKGIELTYWDGSYVHYLDDRIEKFSK